MSGHPGAVLCGQYHGAVDHAVKGHGQLFVGYPIFVKGHHFLAARKTPTSYAPGSGSKENKKQRREKKKILRSIPLDQLPSQNVLSTLDCAEWKIADGLEMCVRKVVETSLNV